MTPEGVVKKYTKKTIAAAEDASGRTIFTDWPVPGGYGKSTLDCVGAVNGVAFYIETKRAGKEPTPRQRICIRELRKANVKVFVIDSDDPKSQQFSDLYHWLLKMMAIPMPVNNQ